MSILKNAQEMQAMIRQGQSAEALEKYYAEHVQVYEMPTGEKRDGREAQRAALKAWQSRVKEIHGGGVNAITANEADQVSCAETWIDFTAQDGHRMRMEEVAVQKWQDGKIVEEKFYYNLPGQ